MIPEPQVAVKSLVFVGGGHAHVHALKEFGMRPIPGVQVTLITRDVDTPYSGMLPGHIAGHYAKEECHIDLRKIARFSEVGLVHTEAVGLDVEQRLVHCKDGRPPIRYDVLSIDIGSTPKFVTSKDPTQLQRVTRVKPIDSFSARWDSIVERVLAPSPQQQQQGQSDSLALETSPARVVIVGGGAGGVELALAMQYRLKELYARGGRDPDKVSVAIVNRGPTVLSSHNRRVQKVFERVLRERKVEVHTGKDVVDVRDPPPQGQGDGQGTLVCSDGTEISFAEAIWCTSSGAADWLRGTGLDLTDDGFIKVNDCLESTNCPGVFAVGDCAHMVNHPRPKAGVFAVRQGPPLEENLRRLLEGRSMKEFQPQTAFLGLISTGDENAVLSWRGLALESKSLWTFKDHIDRKWMRKYKELPEMDNTGTRPEEGGGGSGRTANGSASSKDSLLHAPPVPLAVAAAGPEAVEVMQHASMRCGGCGSKVGAAVLQRVLTRLGVGIDGGQGGRGVVGAGLDDAAIVVPPSEPGAVMVHTVDFFRSFVTDPYVFGRIAANHALSDIHAMGADPATALAIVTVPFGGQAQVEGALEQLLAGALRTLREARCSLVGGHTCEGAEVALGLSVNGVATGGVRSLLGKGGAAPGDVLVLTKAVGTGAILAAEMRGRARSAWVQSAMQSMLESNGPAATILRNHGASACTDVTGFGLVGHLAEMLRAPPLSRQRAPCSAATEAATEADPPPQNGNEAKVTPCGISAELNLDALPLLPGALEVVEDGIVSTLQGQNERDNAAAITVGAEEAGKDNTEDGSKERSRFRLLFDPQTAGGLLASVPRDRAEACVTALREAGCAHACVMGSIKATADIGKGGRIHVGSAATRRTAPPPELSVAS